MNLSYWEYKSWFTDIDFTVVGSGIVGLNCALELKKRQPNAKVLVLEKGMLPQGASTKNAGFACFGSVSEVLRDLESHSPEEVCELVEERWKGIQLLRKTLGDKAIGFQMHGGNEIFLREQKELYQRCEHELSRINQLLQPIYGQPPFKIETQNFGFKGVVPNYLSNALEGQIDTGKMMMALLRKAQTAGIYICNGLGVIDFEENPNGISIRTAEFDFVSSKLCIATNGFARSLLNLDVKPARAQVLVTEPIEGLRIRGTFHLDEGFYYFRNVENRILLGGGRNLDFEGETTAEFGLTEPIQSRLEQLLQEVILPGKTARIERRWSGIMGVGDQKRPIVKSQSKRVFYGIRLGGMGIAIGSLTGIKLAAISSQE